MEKLKPFAVTCLLLAAVACGKKSANDVTQTVKNEVNAQGNPVIQKATYATPCGSSTISEFAGIKFPGMRTEYDMSDLDFTKREIYYGDGKDCLDPIMTVKESGKLRVLGKSGAVPNALSVDFNYEKTTGSLHTDTAVKVFNTANVCDLKHPWVKNVEEDVSSQAGQGLCPGKPAPRTVQEVVLIENDTMYLGDNADRDLSKGRPGKMDRSKPLMKLQ